jgi:hypothetical protein
MLDPETKPWRKALGLLGTLCALFVLLPVVRPVSAAPHYLARLDGSERGEVTAGAFRLDSSRDVRLQVAGAWLSDHPLTDCWLLDAATRETVWALSKEQCVQSCTYGFDCDTTLTLEAGGYEVYFSTVKAGPSISLRGMDSEALSGLLKGLFGDNVMLEGRDFERQSRQAQWGVRVTTPDGGGPDVAPARLAAEERPGGDTLVSIRRTGGKAFSTRAFHLYEPAEVEIYALGEGNRGKLFDYGWLVRSSDRSRPWTMTFEGTTHAGGAGKNRLSREQITLAAGRYEVWYVTDDSHHWGGWNQPPPRDPDFWGITVRLLSADTGGDLASHRGDLPAFPAERVIASIRCPRDNTVSTRMVRLRQGGPVLFYGIGEVDDDWLVDWGWVKDCRSGDVVWAMDASQSDWAGGAGKNVMCEAVAELAPGEYAVTYVTDDSHSGGGGWNATPPWDADCAGLTLYWAGDEADPGSYVAYTPERSPNLLGMIAAAGNHADEAASFELSRPATVRVVCQGEGSQSEMYDYGWIEKADSGERVWTMNFDISRHAGGGKKNREWRGEVTLPAGAYRLRYVSDDSHSFNDWNAEPPSHRGADWGISVYRTR